MPSVTVHHGHAQGEFYLYRTTYLRVARGCRSGPTEALAKCPAQGRPWVRIPPPAQKVYVCQKEQTPCHNLTRWKIVVPAVRSPRGCGGCSALGLGWGSDAQSPRPRYCPSRDERLASIGPCSLNWMSVFLWHPLPNEPAIWSSSLRSPGSASLIVDLAVMFGKRQSLSPQSGAAIGRKELSYQTRHPGHVYAMSLPAKRPTATRTLLQPGQPGALMLSRPTMLVTLSCRPSE